MKKILIITVISSLLFLFGCKKINILNQEKFKINGTKQEIITGENDTTTETETGYNTKKGGNEKLVDTGDIKGIIDEYKAKNTGNSDKLNENDIDLMEKIIDKIGK